MRLTLLPAIKCIKRTKMTFLNNVCISAKYIKYQTIEMKPLIWE